MVLCTSCVHLHVTVSVCLNYEDDGMKSRHQNENAGVKGAKCANANVYVCILACTYVRMFECTHVRVSCNTRTHPGVQNEVPLWLAKSLVRGSS